MTDSPYGKRYGGTAAENYERFFVPAIGGPLAEDLVEGAHLRPGEHVLDVACGTGVVARMAAERVGDAGLVAGLDVNPGMLAVARSETPSNVSIEWHEASAESMPLADEAFDVVFCQMGLQFVPDKLAALREMRRVLRTGGRVYVTLPGPKPAIFEIMADAFARHLSPEGASFVDLVFSMDDAEVLADLLRSAGFQQVHADATANDLHLPAPKDFLWQYVHSTPLAAAAAQADARKLDALETEVCTRWQDFARDGSLSGQVRMTTGTAVK